MTKLRIAFRRAINSRLLRMKETVFNGERGVASLPECLRLLVGELKG
ncbi:MAG: hypothetical protein HY736_02775 [Verrucomicrobia bacterium]|nr:hypothetical protein [Verrucomicrobiota bacterium]